MRHPLSHSFAPTGTNAPPIRERLFQYSMPAPHRAASLKACEMLPLAEPISLIMQHTFHDLPPSTVERRVLTVNEEGRIIAEKRCVCLTRKLIPTNILQHSSLYFRVVASPLIALHTLGVMVCNLQNSRVWFNRSRQSTDVYCSDVMSHVWVGY